MARLVKSFNNDQPQVKGSNIVLDPVGQVPHDNKEAAIILGKFCKSICIFTFDENDKKVKKIAKIMVHNCSTSFLGDPIFYNKFTMQEISVALEAMECRISPGPDNIHGHMVKHLGDKGKQKLLQLFNLSWKLGRLPWECKIIIIIPVEKPGKDSSFAESYMPISLTSFVCKPMERLILARSSFYLSTNDPKEQYGFRRGHSTIN
ncbi:putative RNA-directed DNA polymerase from transposon BS [Trichonephila clavipes]|nr:putative RNA-directed DNA polymerase from transposon BS [Trichonephila clavipes]